MYTNKEKPFYILKGENSIRYFSFIILIAIILFSIYSIIFFSIWMLLMVFAAIFGLICIRFPKISLFENHFEIEKKCIIEKYSDRDVFKYEEIKSVKYVSEGSNKSKLISEIFYAERSYGVYPKPDQMIVKFKNDKTRVYFRIGKKNEFIQTVDKINRKISPATNSR